MASGARARLRAAWPFLRLHKPIFHPYHDILRGHIRQDEEPSLRQARRGRYHAKLAHIPLPCSLWRGLLCHQHPAKRTYRGRLGQAAQQLTVLWSQQPACCLHCSCAAHQGVCDIMYQWCRRMRRNLRTLIVYRWIWRLSLCKNMEHAADWSICSGKELHPSWYGWSHGRSHARPAHRHISYSRNYRWLCPVCAADYSLHGVRDGDEYLRASQHLRHATGKAGQAHHSPYRQGCADTDEHGQHHRERLPQRSSRHAVGQARKCPEPQPDRVHSCT